MWRNAFRDAPFSNLTASRCVSGCPQVSGFLFAGGGGGGGWLSHRRPSVGPSLPVRPRGKAEIDFLVSKPVVCLSSGHLLSKAVPLFWPSSVQSSVFLLALFCPKQCPSSGLLASNSVSFLWPSSVQIGALSSLKPCLTAGRPAGRTSEPAEASPAPPAATGPTSNAPSSHRVE